MLYHLQNCRILVNLVIRAAQDSLSLSLSVFARSVQFPVAGRNGIGVGDRRNAGFLFKNIFRLRSSRGNAPSRPAAPSRSDGTVSDHANALQPSSGRERRQVGGGAGQCFGSEVARNENRAFRCSPSVNACAWRGEQAAVLWQREKREFAKKYLWFTIFGATRPARCTLLWQARRPLNLAPIPE